MTTPIDLRTNCYQEVLEDFGGEGNCLYVHATEHYSIIDPALPYAERFRTHFYTVDINDEEETVEISVKVSASDLMALSVMFAKAAQDAIKEMYVRKDAVPVGVALTDADEGEIVQVKLSNNPGWIDSENPGEGPRFLE